MFMCKLWEVKFKFFFSPLLALTNQYMFIAPVQFMNAAC